jgi:hypothetical protein
VSSKQHWRAPAGWFLQARERGAPPEALAVLAQAAVVSAGHAAGVHQTQRRIGARLGLQRQAVCRWLGRLPDLPGYRRDLQGTRRGVQRIVVPSVRPDQPGSTVWADVVTSPAWIAAPLTFQFVYLGVLDVRSTRPGLPSLRTTHAELAQLLGVARSTVEDAIRYWRHAGLLEISIRTGRGGQHLGLSIRDAGRIESHDVPLTRPSRLAATRCHVARELVERADRHVAGGWAAARARAAAGDVWGLARELVGLVRDAAGRVIPVGRIARALGAVTRSHVDRRRAEGEIQQREAVRADWAFAEGDAAPAPWVPAQGPARLTAAPAGWTWAGALEGIADTGLRQLLELVGSAQVEGDLLWLEDDLYYLRRLEPWLEDLREATGLRIGWRPHARGSPA